MKYPSFPLFLSLLAILAGCQRQPVLVNSPSDVAIDELRQSFVTPPDSVRPGVYWYFMDGNLSREAMTADLESMKEAGIGNVLFLEVNVGVPRGKVDFLSEEWQELFAHAMKECERLGITLTLGVGPGWSGSGGPWVDAGESMRHLVSATLKVSSDTIRQITLPVPEPLKPFFGYGTLTPDLREKWKAHYEDVAVLAFPTPPADNLIPGIDEKALFVRAPYTSMAGVKPYLPEPFYPAPDSSFEAVDPEKILDLTLKLREDGTLDWQVPEGKWTILRMGMRNNGAVTRPAPYPGLGFECDKFDTTAFRNHFNAFIGKLFAKSDFTQKKASGGLTRLHMDSWEMGAQNWSDTFREEFSKRRGYDPLPYLPVFSGLVVTSREVSERFLWDVRVTAQELVLENHAGFIKETGKGFGLTLSIQPYDMNPCADLDLGAVADVPSCEFWLKGVGFNSSFGCVEATSVAHVMGRPVVSAEAFTANAGREGYTAWPGLLKNQGDWAFATGINHFVYHTFAHKALGENLRPGMTMGPYGVHWDRGQTWWPMADGYHRYVSRCSFMLQQGQTVADILYLTPEGAPHVFRPPHSAMEGNDTIPDRRGYNFDGCSPLMLEAASVRDHKITFPGGASYQILVLPSQKTMTPRLAAKIRELIREGATVTGNPPVHSPSLTNYPRCDREVKKLASQIWPSAEIPAEVTGVKKGNGTLWWGGALNPTGGELYPPYEATAALLKSMKVREDFRSDGPVRYTHKILAHADIWFVASKSDQPLKASCTFRDAQGSPECWDPLTGETRELPELSVEGNEMTIPFTFEPYQSFFVVFDHSRSAEPDPARRNFYPAEVVQTLEGPWNVSFDPQWGGPEETVFGELSDWTQHAEKGIRYYSGIAVYRKTFTFKSPGSDIRYFLHTGKVMNMARITLNGKNAGILWTAPWQTDVTCLLKEGENLLEIEVANLWANRLIGDEMLPYDGIQDKAFPDWLINQTPRTSGRKTFSTYSFYRADSPLLESGLLGPVTIREQTQN